MGESETEDSMDFSEQVYMRNSCQIPEYVEITSLNLFGEDVPLLGVMAKDSQTLENTGSMEEN